MIWGSGQVGAVAATRAAAQLAENAKQPAIAGALPEVHHNQVVCFDGDLAGDPSGVDLFRDRVDEPDPIRLRLVLLRDDADDPAAEARATVSERLADDRGIAVSAIAAEGVPAVERLASLIGIIDYASVYLGLMQGIDPTPIAAIDELKQRLR
jgi:glucose/mannose-6-phosphate isomerase